MSLTYETNEHVALITIDREKALNSIDLDTWKELSEAIERLNNEDDSWVGIITGAGEKSFCAGADLRTTIPRLIDDPVNKPYDEPPTIWRGQTATKPLIAAINGMALGGGLEIVLACDLRIAAEHSTFGSPEVKLGFIPGWGGTQRLPRQLPWAIASQICLTGDPITAEEALRYGLINQIVPANEVLAASQKLAATLCERGPLAIKAGKRAMEEGMQMTLSQGLELEHQLFDELAYTADAKEGVAAFIERRAAKFEGR